MSKSNVIELDSRAGNGDLLTELLRTGAKQLIKQAIELELKELLESHAADKTAEGKAVVVRNGYLPAREIQTGIGAVTVQVPKVRTRSGEAVVFRSALVPPYVRKTKSLEAALPWLYLKGISTGEMSEALKVLVGDDAAGLSASTVSRLKQTWADEYTAWRRRDLSKERWVYLWADGIYSGLRSEDDKQCALVVVGVNERGVKHFLAIEDGFRESTQSWRELLLNLKSRGVSRPELAIGDGALGFWSALDEVFPETKHQRCWVHKTANVLNCLPKSSQPKAKKALHDIWQAETQEAANKAFDVFVDCYEAKYPKATVCLQKDREELLTFYRFPAMHWQSIRTSNPIESAFATIRHRTKRSKGCLTGDGMLHMMFKLGQCAQKNWNKLRGFEYLAIVIQGTQFKDGIELHGNNQLAA
ncbi:MAG TPA: IS256 family transposase [Agitococcus sp.]|nr:IS256 family transposase [Pseudomonadales bacterium]MCP5177740.1 IS256 family transposase [Moraxellaceae bacterium]HQV23282.1 IS256 family transposase [Agitococcus sp.]